MKGRRVNAYLILMKIPLKAGVHLKPVFTPLKVPMKRNFFIS